MRQPRPEDYDHYPEREMDPKSEERRAYHNAMCRYWRWKESMPVAKNIPRARLSEVFDQSLGDDHSLVVKTSTRNSVVFCNTVVKIKMKVIEFGGPHRFVTRPIVDDNQSECKAVVFDDIVHPTDVQDCLRMMCTDLVLDTSRYLQCAPSDLWILIL